MKTDSWNRALLVSGLYFGIVFGAGFLLGPIRVLFLEPRVGQRWAELMELPLMVVVIVFAARWIVLRSGSILSGGKLLGAGLLAMVTVLVADFGVGVWVRGMTLREVVTQRDLVSGCAYYSSLIIFGLMPWAVKRFRKC